MSTRILIVEDDERFAKLTSEVLVQAGYTTRIEQSGDRAIPRILEEQPDVVILDINLPGKDGLTICREIRPDYGGHILVLTARGDEVVPDPKC